MSTDQPDQRIAAGRPVAVSASRTLAEVWETTDRAEAARKDNK